MNKKRAEILKDQVLNGFKDLYSDLEGLQDEIKELEEELEEKDDEIKELEYESQKFAKIKFDTSKMIDIEKLELLSGFGLDNIPLSKLEQFLESLKS